MKDTRRLQKEAIVYTQIVLNVTRGKYKSMIHTMIFINVTHSEKCYGYVLVDIFGSFHNSATVIYHAMISDTTVILTKKTQCVLQQVLILVSINSHQTWRGQDLNDISSKGME